MVIGRIRRGGLIAGLVDLMLCGIMIAIAPAIVAAFL
jgi:hypothetical protein